MKRTDIILRSMLFVPGHNEKLLLKAAETKADALILDLEDSVPGRLNKSIARQLIRQFVLDDKFKKKDIFPRINDIESGWLLEDIQALAIPGVHGFVCPKIMRGKDVYFIDQLLKAIERENKMFEEMFKIIPLIETASAVYNVQEICEASDRVIALAFGCEDFIADLEGIHDIEGESLKTPRALIALAARATGVIPIDTVNIDVHNLEQLEKNVKFARRLGFEGQLCLHPKELDVVHKYYSPSKKEVVEAHEMIRLAEVAEKEGKGVAVIDGKFIGPPMIVSAKKMIERDELIKAKKQ